MGQNHDRYKQGRKGRSGSGRHQTNVADDGPERGLDIIHGIP
jgi:hypothetical protein